ncbi:MAG: 1-deoxy-D-xylulose-5-phosphate reductoisomerase [Treponema sp.]|nr:1-deoxy-D-xylulose-5-phosphate reductoisomerase [Treponema sp.]
MKKVLVLGCTGSIGTSALDIIKNMPHDFCACGLVAHTSREKAAALAKAYGCPYALTSEDGECIEKLLRQTQADIALNGIAGSAGLLPSKAVLEAGVDLALANKETVVMAWHLIEELAKKTGAKIIPVDSEHSAIFQLINKIGKEHIAEILITASGGPFREHTKEQLASVTAGDALNHPTWSMGKKITIDSATLANKGLEVIEACRLFDVAPEKVKVVVHPQSIVHSLVRTKDGMLYAQLSDPDMRHPIFSALSFPAMSENYLQPFDLCGTTLTFCKPRTDDFPLLAYAYEAAERGEGCTIAYNAADEVAALAFLDGKIRFTGIAKIVRRVLDNDWTVLPQTFDDVFTIDKNARAIAEQLI